MTTKEMENALAAQGGRKPEGYSSAWEAQMGQIMQRILNRENFQYNLNGDALYRQYRNQAARDGQLAMRDAMGQAAALTGGYGSSYVQSVGQQAYSRELERVADRIPELYALALEQYRQQTEDLQQKYQLLAGADARDYSRYQDSLTQWQQEADRLQKAYLASRDFDYGVYRDSVADRKWQTDFDESVRRYDQEWLDKHPQVTAAPAVTTTQPAKKPAAEKDKKGEALPSTVVL